MTDDVDAEPTEGIRDAAGDATRDRPRQNIVWIASYPKSGNTWIRIFLHNLMRELRGETEGSQDINSLGLFAIWEHSIPHYTRALGKRPEEATLEEVARARPQVQRMISAERRGLALAKTHLCFGRDHGYPTISLAVTRAAVYVVRNPLDVAVSYAHHCDRPIDAIIADMATPGLHTPLGVPHVSETIGSWSQHVASWMGVAHRPVYLMRYEDMMEHPRETFAGLASYLNLRPTVEQLDTAIQKSSFEELSQQEEERGFRERPAAAKRFFRQGIVGGWRDALTEQQATKIVRAHASMMQRIGYLRSSAVGGGVR